ncbi:MAG: heme peroxidase family protein [Blastocatellia bacterium]|nr:heme peroxidase family protein [Blastocatellia bacterium]
MAKKKLNGSSPKGAGQPGTMRMNFHGVMRGADSAMESTMFEGRFGRMFRNLPAAHFFEEDLEALGEAMTSAPEKDEQGNLTATAETEPDGEENQGPGNVPAIAAGFTYLGQFIDHDLTFDPMSSLVKQNDPDQLTDFRTPRFDLDSVYGRGPDAQPYLYEDDGRRLKLGRRLTGAESFDPNARDLPRHTSEKGGRARALIGDPRNDENVIVAQLHANVLRFHNFMTDFMGSDAAFEEVQRQVRWHYQWVVLHDFLPTIVGSEMVYSVLPHLRKRTSIHQDKPNLLFYRWRNEPFMPVEFSVAAYRFGHSMIRPVYRLNQTLLGGGPDKDPINGRQFIFTKLDSEQGLNGFREFPDNWAIDWSLYFDMGNKPPKFGVKRVQPAYKIDSSLVNPLGDLPASVATQIGSLAKRNLKRSARMGLPSGQDVARLMGIKPIPDEKLRVGKAAEEDVADNLPITEYGDSFMKRAPLWFYILAESQQAFKKDSTPILLGPVGSRIVAEVFIGLLLGDGHSFLRQDPGWTPEKSFLNKDGKFGMAELIKQARKAS